MSDDLEERVKQLEKTVQKMRTYLLGEREKLKSNKPFDKTEYMREYMADRRKAESNTTLTDAVKISAQFWAELKPLYPGIDLESEQRHMLAWLMTPRGRGRKLTRKFIVSWLNKCDASLAPTVKYGRNGQASRTDDAAIRQQIDAKRRELNKIMGDGYSVLAREDEDKCQRLNNEILALEKQR